MHSAVGHRHPTVLAMLSHHHGCAGQCALLLCILRVHLQRGYRVPGMHAMQRRNIQGLRIFPLHFQKRYDLFAVQLHRGGYGSWVGKMQPLPARLLPFSIRGCLRAVPCRQILAHQKRASVHALSRRFHLRRRSYALRQELFRGILLAFGKRCLRRPALQRPWFPNHAKRLG